MHNTPFIYIGRFGNSIFVKSKVSKDTIEVDRSNVKIIKYWC
jgi:hypothetical protein